eukprot:SAG22_NODE_4285_length_1317_cov_1.371100_2_plen_26_part_01
MLVSKHAVERLQPRFVDILDICLEVP